MLEQGWQVVTRYDEELDGLRLWFIKVEGDSRIVVNPIDLTMTSEAAPYAEWPEPTIRIDALYARQFLTSLADGIIQAGYIPDSAKENKGIVKYLEEEIRYLKHLVDTLLSLHLGKSELKLEVKRKEE